MYFIIQVENFNHVKFLFQDERSVAEYRVSKCLKLPCDVNALDCSNIYIFKPSDEVIIIIWSTFYFTLFENLPIAVASWFTHI